MMNNVNSHYSEENNCKTELSVQYIFFVQGNVLYSDSNMNHFLHDRTALFPVQ